MIEKNSAARSQACGASTTGHAWPRRRKPDRAVLELYDNLAFSRALEEIWSVIAATDKYLTTEHPWSLGESDADQQRRATILWTTAKFCES